MQLILQQKANGQRTTAIVDFAKDDTYGEWHCVESPIPWMVGCPPRRIKRWLDGPGAEQGWRYRWSWQTNVTPRRRARRCRQFVEDLKVLRDELGDFELRQITEKAV